MMLYFIDCNLNKKIHIYRIDLENGETYPPRIIENNLKELVLQILKDKPNKIIFDKNGIGMSYYDSFMIYKDEYKNFKKVFDVDSKGNVYWF